MEKYSTGIDLFYRILQNYNRFSIYTCNAIHFKTAKFLSRVTPVVAPVFASLQQSDFGKEAGKRLTFHVGRRVGAPCGQSDDLRVCRRVTRRVHNRARIHVGVLCA